MILSTPTRFFSKTSRALSKSTGKQFGSDSSLVTENSSSQLTSAKVSTEFQRQRAKEMTKYFRDVRQEREVAGSKVLGWTYNNEITNGRWVMMGLAIGLLTEYATGVNFIDQIKLTVSYLGIADVDY